MQNTHETAQIQLIH